MVKYRREEWFDIIGDEPCTGVKERLSPIQDDYDVTDDYLLQCIITTVGSFTIDPSNVTGVVEERYSIRDGPDVYQRAS